MDRGAIVSDNDWSFLSSWEDYILDFKENVFPAIFQPHGIDFQTALLIWEIDKVGRYVRQVRENTGGDPTDDWKKGSGEEDKQ